MTVRKPTTVFSPARSLSLRRIWVVLAAVPILSIGCGKPTADFVPHERTEKLYRPARDKVEEALEQNFGTPHELVAWVRFPVNFGQYDGEVVAGDGAESNRMTVKLTSPASEATSEEDNTQTQTALTADDVTGMGLLWATGKYVGATQQTEEGGEAPLNFQVVNYDSESHLLSLNAVMSAPPEPGDRFILVGNVLQRGRRLYMEHCMHCHGVSGDGNGPTAPYLNPRPRDYRLGIFKFTSTRQANKASRDDLKRIVQHGVPGTYMPSFLLLEDDELGAIIEYIRWLAIRGEFEKFLADGMGQFTEERIQQRIEDGEEREAIEQELQEYLAADFVEGDFGINGAAAVLEEQWKASEEAGNIVIPLTSRPSATPDSIARGRALFLSAQAQCALCHGTTGRGDGPNNFAYNKKTGTEELYDEPGLFDDWGNKIQPRDLTKGIYRGGRRPLDLYRRIYASIKGTPMPAFGNALTTTNPETGKRDDRQIWDLVNYLMSLPYEPR